MKIGIYSPYLDTLGGGERYMISLASHWSKSHEVYLYWDSLATIQDLAKRFDLDVSRITVRRNVFSRGLIQKLAETKRLDLLFILSDGSVPYSLARKNIIHFQVPFKTITLGMIKNFIYSKFIFNSEFTRFKSDPRIHSKSSVIYPGVTMYSIGNKDETTILSVGRFEGFYKVKKQGVLINAFKRMKDMGIKKEVKLLLAGGLLSRDQEYFNSLKSMAQGLNIEFYPNVSYDDLASLYTTSSVYWHAAGFGESDPKRMEHFGISTVESMSAGCIPIVFNGGGLHEIIRRETEGFLWSTEEQLIQKTRTVLSHPFSEKSRINIRKRAMDFRDSVFFDAFDRLLQSL
ncbi:glycosyltransferase family 4 protein [Candidatus Gottesmanbacteria bacterium]|nr:glycosyltransferase family 4 protein [Candidatus Gottesmanbacteria bacterium]